MQSESAAGTNQVVVQTTAGWPCNGIAVVCTARAADGVQGASSLLAGVCWAREELPPRRASPPPLQLASSCPGHSCCCCCCSCRGHQASLAGLLVLLDVQHLRDARVVAAQAPITRGAQAGRAHGSTWSAWEHRPPAVAHLLAAQGAPATLTHMQHREHTHTPARLACLPHMEHRPFW